MTRNIKPTSQWSGSETKDSKSCPGRQRAWIWISSNMYGIMWRIYFASVTQLHKMWRSYGREFGRHGTVCQIPSSQSLMKEWCNGSLSCRWQKDGILLIKILKKKLAQFIMYLGRYSQFATLTFASEGLKIPVLRLRLCTARSIFIFTHWNSGCMIYRYHIFLCQNLREG